MELKPCPFCGVTPHLNTNVYSNDGRVSVTCKNDLCEVGPSLSKRCQSEMWPDGKSCHYILEQDTKIKAIEAWNRRV